LSWEENDETAKTVPWKRRPPDRRNLQDRYQEDEKRNSGSCIGGPVREKELYAAKIPHWRKKKSVSERRAKVALVLANDMRGKPKSIRNHLRDSTGTSCRLWGCIDREDYRRNPGPRGRVTEAKPTRPEGHKKCGAWIGRVRVSLAEECGGEVIGRISPSVKPQL